MCIAEEDRLPPLRPKARMGGPRGRQLWEKVRLNKNLLIGEGVGTHGASGYWRLRAGVGAFFFSVDMDVNGRKKNRGSRYVKPRRRRVNARGFLRMNRS